MVSINLLVAGLKIDYENLFLDNNYIHYMLL